LPTSPDRKRGAQPSRAQNPADRAFVDPVPEAKEFALDAPVTQRGFSRTSRITRSRISAGSARLTARMAANSAIA
jgi:hypothetical protein